jgi:SAM-dependent methyltransferase
MKELFPPDSIFIQEDVRKNRWAIPYHHEALNGRINKIIVENSDAVKGKRILDLGCHFGTFAYGAIKEGASFVKAIDSEEPLIDKAYDLFQKMNVPEETFEFSVGDIITFLENEPENSYDTILCLGVFYYLNDLHYALSLMKKVARKYIIIDTFTAYYGACISKEGETIFRSTIHETYDLPIIIFPRIKSEKADYTLQSHYVTERDKKLSVMALPSETVLQYFFYLLNMSYKKLDWEEFRVNSYTWQDFVDPDIKKASHWADVYLTNIRVAYAINTEK